MLMRKTGITCSETHYENKKFQVILIEIQQFHLDQTTNRSSIFHLPPLLKKAFRSQIGGLFFIQGLKLA